MQIEPAVLIAFIAAVLGLIGLVFRSMAAGDLHSRNLVPREDYERVVAINEGYVAKFGEQTDAIKTLTGIVESFVRANTNSAPVRRGRVGAQADK